jgi:hypothetical protein
MGTKLQPLHKSVSPPVPLSLPLNLAFVSTFTSSFPAISIFFLISFFSFVITHMLFANVLSFYLYFFFVGTAMKYIGI